jgi:predicted nucleic acid-binding protein
MRVLLDTNVLLDSISQRPPWHKDTDAILQSVALGQVSAAATSLSLATLFYVGQKTVGIAAARAGVRKFLVALAILPIDRQTLLDADGMAGSDFEDNILIAAAVTASLDAIVTRNVRDFAHSPIPVSEPAELLKRLATPSPTQRESAASRWTRDFQTLPWPMSKGASNCSRERGRQAWRSCRLDQARY